MITRAALLVATGLLALACGGLVPTEPPAPDAPGPEPAAEPAPLELPTPLPDGGLPAADPYASFPPLDAGEQAPTRTDPVCPEGAAVIRYPRGPALEVYCATTEGMKQGPWHRVQGSAVSEVRAYDHGQQVGRAVRWSKSVKIAESNWVAGVEEGDVAEWNDAGILMLRGTMKEGRRHGKFLLRAPAAPDAFDGRCFDRGAEVWATTDPSDFLARACP